MILCRFAQYCCIIVVVWRYCGNIFDCCRGRGRGLGRGRGRGIIVVLGIYCGSSLEPL